MPSAPSPAPLPPKTTRPIASAVPSALTTAEVRREASRIDPVRIDIDAEFWVEEITTPEQLKESSDRLSDLLSTAANTNVFLEPWNLEAALRHLGPAEQQSARPTIAVVYQRGRATQFPPIAIGVFATTVGSDLGRLAGPILSMWRHPYSFDGTPIVRRGWAESAVRVFFEWAAMRRSDCRFVRFDDYSVQSPFAAALTAFRRKAALPSVEIDAWSRALLVRHDSNEAYLDAAVSPSTRRELRRQLRRLEDVGVVETRLATEADEVDAWIEDFLSLEQRGWKQGTAIIGDNSHAAYFREAIATSAARGQCDLLSLTLDGKPIAMKCNFFPDPSSPALGQRTGATFKITFDETFKKFSPGLLLELATIRHFHEQSDTYSLDSCAIPGHPMIERLWCDRTIRADHLIAVGGIFPTTLIAAAQAIRWVKRSLRKHRSGSAAIRDEA